VILDFSGEHDMAGFVNVNAIDSELFDTASFLDQSV
jgi:hypothetical protein